MNDFDEQTYSEYFLKAKHELNNFSVFEDKEVDDNPFGFGAFKSINHIAQIFNYDVYGVIELDEKDNPFKQLNKDINIDI